MRWIAAALLAVVLSAQTTIPPAPKPERPVTVEGRVLNAKTNEPLSRATLMLLPARAPTSPEERAPGFSATSTADGHYSFQGIPPGSYHLSASRARFVGTAYGSRRAMSQGAILNLAAGETLSNVDLRMIPQAVITGRITSESGEPLMAIMVSLLALRSGQPQLAARAETDDLGEYRFPGLSQGDYWLRAEERQLVANLHDRSATPVVETRAPAYFPGGTDFSRATRVHVDTGKEAAGLDFVLAKVRGSTVRGRILAAGSSGTRGDVFLIPTFYPTGTILSGTSTSVTGDFEIRAVAPGSYTLQAFRQQGTSRMTASMKLNVTADVENATLTLIPAVQLKGVIELAEPAKWNPASVSITLTPLERRQMVMLAGSSGIAPSFTAGSAKPLPDGSFTLSNLLPERYSVSVARLPEGYYLKSARVEDQDVLEAGLDAAHPPAGLLRVTVSNKSGTIVGMAKDSAGKPVVGATVVLIPTVRARIGRDWFYRAAATDQIGHYRLSGIEPGTYKLLAWDDVEPDAWLDAEFLKGVEEQAVPAVIGESASQTIDLQSIPVNSDR